MPYAPFEYVDKNGKSHRLERRMRTYTMEEVVFLREQLRNLANVDQNISIYKRENGVDTSFGNIAIEWIEYKTRSVRPYTVKRYCSILDNHLLPKLHDLDISKISRSTLQEIIDQLGNQNKVRTAQFCHRVLSNLFKFALKREYITTNIFIDIELPRYTARKIEVFTKDEAKLFLNFAQRSKHGLMFEFALITGMRPEEYFGLQWDALDFEHGLAIVKQSLNLQMPERVEFQNVKSKNSLRQILLPQRLLDKLQTHKLNSHPTSLNLVFPAENGNPLRLNNISRRHFTPLAKQITDKRIHLYSLRHTCATLLLLAGENPKVVAERLGNSIEITLKTYSHVLPNMQKAASGSTIFNFADSAATADLKTAACVCFCKFAI
ncbi:MAG: tyrosine-type recombinase/integrase [Pyrinomonadaceae bacterium]